MFMFRARMPTCVDMNDRKIQINPSCQRVDHALTEIASPRYKTSGEALACQMHRGNYARHANGHPLSARPPRHAPNDVAHAHFDPDHAPCLLMIYNHNNSAVHRR